ncbi:IS6 family transposase, partial [Thiotrichales bacterium 19X7-9]|nr:IS6 family transposase [Thiotrichales bacterium 19X7-9]MCF6777929.1 IS6 family transposase [Thiotrichales bacterium 19X7-9]MCF6777972.1 IS6 family transposase [Thiotrichales bacterium 19X7-9]
MISFKWRHFNKMVIMLAIRWYLSYSLSYRDVEELLLERGFKVDHTTVYRWVISYADQLE